MQIYNCGDDQDLTDAQLAEVKRMPFIDRDWSNGKDLWQYANPTSTDVSRIVGQKVPSGFSGKAMLDNEGFQWEAMVQGEGDHLGITQAQGQQWFNRFGSLATTSRSKTTFLWYFSEGTMEPAYGHGRWMENAAGWPDKWPLFAWRYSLVRGIIKARIGIAMSVYTPTYNADKDLQWNIDYAYQQAKQRMGLALQFKSLTGCEVHGIVSGREAGGRTMSNGKPSARFDTSRMELLKAQVRGVCEAQSLDTKVKADSIDRWGAESHFRAQELQLPQDSAQVISDSNARILLELDVIRQTVKEYGNG